MRALAIDVGTGTQDVLLFDAEREIENAVRLILPSPTVLVADRIRAATAARRGVVLTGVTMGGGPSSWAARDHALAGFPIAATADAARTFDDDLAGVTAMGVRVIEPDEAAALVGEGGVGIELTDAWLDELAGALGAFDIDVHSVDAVALAVFDHGAAPPGVSDRRFRFERLRERLAAAPEAGPAAFAYLDGAVPLPFTRLAAAARSVRTWLGRDEVPVLAMDTGPAAILGALDDPVVRRGLARRGRVVAANIGNFHALAMRLAAAPGTATGVAIEVVLEHHTGVLGRRELVRHLREVAAGTVSDAAVFASMGHGALVSPGAAVLPVRRAPLAVTGPRRALLGSAAIPGMGRPAMAVPHGDMMQAGSFGLLRALAQHVPAWRDAVAERLGPAA